MTGLYGLSCQPFRKPLPDHERQSTKFCCLVVITAHIYLSLYLKRHGYLQPFPQFHNLEFLPRAMYKILKNMFLKLSCWIAALLRLQSSVIFCHFAIHCWIVLFIKQFPLTGFTFRQAVFIRSDTVPRKVTT